MLFRSCDKTRLAERSSTELISTRTRLDWLWAHDRATVAFHASTTITLPKNSLADRPFITCEPLKYTCTPALVGPTVGDAVGLTLGRRVGTIGMRVGCELGCDVG